MYNILEHGDPLEKNAATFIDGYFKGYEQVWKIFVGNTGESKMSSIPGYEDEEKRINFAENSYSLFEASYLCFKIVDSGVFNKTPESIEEHINLTNNFHLYFVFLGRMHDLAEKLTEKFDVKKESFLAKIKPFYQIRNIVIHGKKVPLNYDENNIIIMPKISGKKFGNEVWHDEQPWDVFEVLDKENLQTALFNHFTNFIALINEHYFDICKQIKNDLNGNVLKFEYIELTGDNHSIASGTTTVHKTLFNTINTSGSGNF